MVTCPNSSRKKKRFQLIDVTLLKEKTIREGHRICSCYIIHFNSVVKPNTLYCIWIRILKFAPIYIRIQALIWIRIQTFLQQYIFHFEKKIMWNKFV